MSETDIKNSTDNERIFLCIVDESDEMDKALRFACGRAKNTNGTVALLMVIEPAEFQHWMFVGNLMQEENREEAEEMMNVLSALVERRTGKKPMTYIREGNLREKLLELIKENPNISVVILGADSGKNGPGPLVTSLLEKRGAGSFPIPVTIVPGHLTKEQIEAIT